MTEQFGWETGAEEVDEQEGRMLIKHSASIQITNRISFLARRISNVLLANARKMPSDTIAYEIPVAELRREIDYNSKNMDHLKSAVKSLAGTVVEYNIFDKDRGNEWGVFALLSQVKIRDNKVVYWYPPDIRELLMSPNVYARLDLAVQNKFSSKHSIALWEYLTDALGAKRPTANILLAIADFRKLMSLDPREYTEFSDLNKRVIKPALSEINAHSKISVTLEVRRKGRIPEALLFGVMRCVVEKANETAQSPTHVPPLSIELRAPQVKDQKDKVLERLIHSFKLKPITAKNILAEYELDYICGNLDIVERTIKKGTVRNVAAYTVGALKADYRGKSDENWPPAPAVGQRHEMVADESNEEERISKARQWFEMQPADRRERVRELFIAGLNVVQISPVRDSYHRFGFEHPEVMRAFLLHVAANLDKKRGNPPR